MPLAGFAVDRAVRVAIVDAADGPGRHRAVAGRRGARWTRRREALADAGYEVVAEKTPGFARAFDLWFEMFIPEFRRFMQADFERDGDDGHPDGDAATCSTTCRNADADDAPDARWPSARALIRDWNVFLARTPLVLTVGVHGVALRARLRRRERGADAASSGASARR